MALIPWRLLTRGLLQELRPVVSVPASTAATAGEHVHHCQCAACSASNSAVSVQQQHRPCSTCGSASHQSIACPAVTPHCKHQAHHASQQPLQLGMRAMHSACLTGDDISPHALLGHIQQEVNSSPIFVALVASAIPSFLAGSGCIPLLAARRLKREPEPFEAEFDEDEHEAGEFEDLGPLGEYDEYEFDEYEFSGVHTSSSDEEYTSTEDDTSSSSEDDRSDRSGSDWTSSSSDEDSSSSSSSSSSSDEEDEGHKMLPSKGGSHGGKA